MATYTGVQFFRGHGVHIHNIGLLLPIPRTFQMLINKRSKAQSLTVMNVC